MTTSPAHLPTLAENQLLRFLTVTVMYFAQGIQSGLIITALPAYMAMQEISPSVISSFVGIVLLPWSLKLVSAPIMDRFSFLPMGRRRPWIIASMFGALIGYVMMAMVPDPLNNINLLIVAGIVVSASTAFMDAAVDGMTIDIILPEEHSKANAYMWGGRMLGFSATTAIATWALSNYGIPLTFITVATMVGILTLFPICFRERRGERLFPWSLGQASPTSLQLQAKSWSDIFRNLFQVIFLPSSILLALIAFLNGTTNGLLKVFLPILTVQELGWTDTDYANLVASASFTAGLLSMFIGGNIIARLGTLRGLKIILLALVGIGAIMGLLPMMWEEVLTIKTFIFSLYIIRTLLLIALFTACMAICWKKVAATQFTLYMTISNLGISLGAGFFGFLQKWCSSAQIFFVFAAVIFLLFLLVQKVDLDETSKKIKTHN